GTDGGPFGLHPALFDASLHAAAFGGGDGEGQGGGVPFSWMGVSLHATGASAVRVRIRTATDGGVSIAIADTTGAPVASVESLVVRPIAADQLNTVDRDSLFRLDWTPVQVTDTETVSYVGLDQLSDSETEAVPAAVVVEVGGEADVVASTHELTAHVLDLLQSWLVEERFEESRLTFVTRGATTGGDLAGAAVWGMVRSAQSENPGRFGLVDLDDDADASVLSRALAVDEPQLLVRGGEFLAARLARVTAEPVAEAPWRPDGTVLVTGGTGGLGRIVARHLATHHGVRNLLLVSRSGQGAEALVAELAAEGVDVVVEACDVADPAVVADLVSRHARITAVVHTAGVLDDGTIPSLTPDRVSTVLRPKVDAVWNLHEATQHLDLDAFVVFSSAAGTFGTPGQANYAAGNAFLDALARHRRAEGLAGVSLAWGPWAQDSGMTGTLTEADVQRIARTGMPELSAEEGVALFDRALALADEPVTLPVRLDLAALRARGEVPPLLRGLIRTPAGRRAASAGAGGGAAAADLAQRLSGLSAAEGREVLLDAVRGQIATVLGHAGGAEVDPAKAFRDLGFDSLTAVELRNRLSALTGVRLPATLLFDYPTAGELVDHLYAKVAPADSPSGPEAVLGELDRLEKAFLGLEVTEEVFERVAGRLEVLRSKWGALRDAGKGAGAGDATGSGEDAEFDFESASDEDVFDLLDNELGLSDEI
ncbi:type I polyketide synthase, partial [Streptomyces sp. L500]